MSQATSNRCSLCAEPIKDQDFTAQNFVIGAEDGLQHKKCPNINTSNFNFLWTEQCVSEQSQYSHQSAGSCTINALETALRLQTGSKPSVTLINDVLAMASLYTSSMHTGVADVLPHVTRYKSVLKSVDWIQCNVSNISQVVTILDKNVKNSKHDCSCVITKPPESIFLHKTYKNGSYVLYDSHPRREKGLNGSHFLMFADAKLLNDYLLILFPFVNLGRGYGLYGDMMNQCEATYLQIDFHKHKDMESLKENIVNRIDYTQIGKDLGIIGFKLQKQYSQKQYPKVKNNLLTKIKNKVSEVFESKADENSALINVEKIEKDKGVLMKNEDETVSQNKDKNVSQNKDETTVQNQDKSAVYGKDKSVVQNEDESDIEMEDNDIDNKEKDCVKVEMKDNTDGSKNKTIPNENDTQIGNVSEDFVDVAQDIEQDIDSVGDIKSSDYVKVDSQIKVDGDMNKSDDSFSNIIVDTTKSTEQL